MPDRYIPDDVRQFILENIDTIAQLEGLLLFRAHSAPALTAEDVAQRLYINKQDAEALISHFIARGYLKTVNESDNRYIYDTSDELKRTIDSVADSYGRYLVPLTHLIHSKRKSKIQKFADAFRIRKD